MSKSFEFPRYTKAAQQGERGVQVVSTIVFEKFGWIFKRNHQEYDFGIDGQIEVVTGEGNVTGQLIAVQVKCGGSFLKEKNNWGYIYRGEEKHFNYLANYPIPVIIILCDPDSKKCYWVKFRTEITRKSGSNWKLTVPFENDLDHSKKLLEELLPPLKNYQCALEEYWELNNLLVESPCIYLIIDKSDVKEMNIQRIRDFFDRLRVTKELALECHGKIAISFHGYDDDPRELFEIKEVRQYSKDLFNELPEFFFFIRTENPDSLITFALCQTDVSWINGRSTPTITKKVECDTTKLIDFLMRGFAGLNDMTAWLSLSEEENTRISKAVTRCLGFPENL